MRWPPLDFIDEPRYLSVFVSQIVEIEKTIASHSLSESKQVLCGVLFVFGTTLEPFLLFISAVKNVQA